jgi:hypothetical protein
MAQVVKHLELKKTGKKKYKTEITHNPIPRNDH